MKKSGNAVGQSMIPEDGNHRIEGLLGSFLASWD